MVYCGTEGFILANESNTTCAEDHSLGASDMDNIVVDFIGQYAVALLGFVTLIALVALAVWFKMKTNKLR